jgi:hypothetical protein
MSGTASGDPHWGMARAVICVTVVRIGAGQDESTMSGTASGDPHWGMARAVMCVTVLRIGAGQG